MTDAKKTATKKEDPQEEKTDSYLHEAQQSGKASGDLEISDLDAAIGSVHEILDEEAADFYKKNAEEKWQTAKLSIYCHDCRKLVPSRMAKVRRKVRPVCGECGSRKISMGRAEALEKYYHLEK